MKLYKIKIAVFPPAYCVHLYTAVKGLEIDFERQTKVVRKKFLKALCGYQDESFVEVGYFCRYTFNIS